VADFEFWTLLAGLGIFLFGMYTMEESIKLLAGPSFKHLIRRYTGSRLKGLITGIISTAVLQSSSAVSLMVLAFVGAGLMSLTNAIAVMVGSNIGTTLTVWIVAILGFKIKIDAFALPLIGIGGLGMIFLARSLRYYSLSRLLVALGLLFHGLEMMKSSVSGLSSSVDLGSLPYTGLWFYLIMGVFLTAAMQASAATIALVLAGLHSGMIGFDDGAAMVIGANIGTTITILLGAIGGSNPKKQAAFSHVAFNTVSAAFALVLFPLLLWVILDLADFSQNGVLGIALFHTMFNCLGAAVFLPFLQNFTRLLNRIYPESRNLLSRFINLTAPDVVEAALVAFRNEVLNQLFLSVYYICHKYSIEPRDSDLEEDYPEHLVTYGGLAELHAEIFRFYSGIPVERSEAESVHLDSILRASRSIMNSTRNLRELLNEVLEMQAEESGFTLHAVQDFRGRLVNLKGVVTSVFQHPERATLMEDLDDYFASVEQVDRVFIASLSRAVRNEGLSEEEVTRLLMVNRLFTQSCRMLTLSMKGIINSYHGGSVTLDSLE
tara:strand:- start:62122 stop:63765 length:1644 start_codon:yes stop_codon:yes gene_type:complete